MLSVCVRACLCVCVRVCVCVCVLVHALRTGKKWMTHEWWKGILFWKTWPFQRCSPGPTMSQAGGGVLGTRGG